MTLFNVCNKTLRLPRILNSNFKWLFWSLNSKAYCKLYWIKSHANSCVLSMSMELSNFLSHICSLSKYGCIFLKRWFTLIKDRLSLNLLTCHSNDLILGPCFEAQLEALVLDHCADQNLINDMIHKIAALWYNLLCLKVQIRIGNCFEWWCLKWIWNTLFI